MKHRTSRKKRRETRLQFAVRLTTIDLDAISSKEHDQLMQLAHAFCVTFLGEHREVPITALPTDGRGAELQNVQRRAKSILRFVAQHHDSPTGKTLPLDLQTVLKMTLCSSHQKPKLWFMVEAPLEDAFSYILAMELLASPSGRVAICPRCSTLFLRTTNKLYCRDLCTWQANKEEARKAPKARALLKVGESIESIAEKLNSDERTVRAWFSKAPRRKRRKALSTT